MECRNRLQILGGAMTMAWILIGGLPAFAQTREAKGTVTSVSETTLTIKAGAQEVSFYVDGRTQLEVRQGEKELQRAAAGSPSPRVNDFFQPGQAVFIQYQVEGGRNRALDVRRVGRLGAGGGSISEASKIADGKVKAITASRLTLEEGGKEMVFMVNRDTNVMAKGATNATQAAGGSPQITTFIHAGDMVSVSYKEAAGTMTASEVRLRVVNR